MSKIVRLSLVSLLMVALLSASGVIFAKDVTISVWTSYVPGADAAHRAAFEEIISGFEKANPGIKVKHDAFSFNDHLTSVKLAVQGGTGPDVLVSQVGADCQDLYFRKGLLMDLSPMAVKNGWTKNYPDWTLAFPNLGYDKSKAWKGPKIAVIPFYLQPLGIFYNRTLFKKYNVAEPTNWKELNDALATFKAQGVTPISFGNLEKFMFLHFTWAALHASVSPDRIKDWYYFRDTKVKMTDPDFIKGLDWEVSLAKNGFFTKDFDAVGRDDAQNFFLAQKAAMIVVGNWMIPTYSKTPFEVGFFPVPMMDANATHGYTGDMGWGAGIVSYSKHKKEAEKFLTYCTSNAAGRAWYRQGSIPAMKFDASGIQVSAIQTEVYEKLQGLVIGQYLDTAAPGLIDIMMNQGQLLLAGKITSQDWAAQVQQAMEAWGKKIGKIK